MDRFSTLATFSPKEIADSLSATIHGFSGRIFSGEMEKGAYELVSNLLGVSTDALMEYVERKGETETRRVTDIVWCADPDDGFGEDELPTEVDIPADVEDDKIADYLSDTYGYRAWEITCGMRSHRPQIIAPIPASIRLDMSRSTGLTFRRPGGSVFCL